MDAPNPGEAIALSLSKIPILDVQGRVNGSRLAARGLHDLLAEQSLHSELRASSLEHALAGGLPEDGGAEALIHWSIPRLSRVRNTMSGWSLRILVRDLYDWDEPLTAGNWRRLDAQVRERASDSQWPGEVLKRAGIARICTDRSGRGLGTADGLLQYSLEWGGFLHSHTDGFDAALYELERTWGRAPEPPEWPAPKQRPPTYRVIRTVQDIHAAAGDYVRALPVSEIVAVTLRLGRHVPAATPSDSEMESALARRPQAGAAEGAIYSAYIAEALLEALETRAADLSLLVPVSGRACDSTPGAMVATLAAWAVRHPRLQMIWLPDSAELNAALCAQARTLPNVAVAGIPWGVASLGDIGRAFADRLDLLPIGRQCAFSSDAGCVEWAYARSIIARKQWAEVLGARLRLREFNDDEVSSFAREAVFGSARHWLRMTSEPGVLRG